MAEFSEAFKVYPNKNAELRAVAKIAYEFGMNISQEPSAGQSLGLDEHAIARQRSYVTTFQGYLNALHDRPIPDMPYVHPARFDINLSEEYKHFTKEGIPINEDTELLASYWMIAAVELAASQSAGLGGSLTDADYGRVTNHAAVISQLLDEIEARGNIDLPETAYPAAILEVPARTSGS